MAFDLGRFDVIKQNYDKTGLYMYHDTVGTATDPSTKVAGDLKAAIAAAGFFNPVAETLQAPGGIIIVTATDGGGVYRVTGVYGEDGKPNVTVAALA